MASSTTALNGERAPLAPLFPGVPILGIGPIFLRQPIETFFNATNACGDVARLKLPRRPFVAHILRHPDHIQQVLVDNSRNYGKQTVSYARLGESLGQGLVTSEGDFWKRQRRIANPAFHRDRIERFADTMVGCAREMVESWRPRVISGEPFDVAKEMMAVTLRIIGLTMLSTDVQGEASAVAGALDDILHVTIARIFDPFSLPLWVPTPQNLRFRRGLHTLDVLMEGLIAERRRSAEDRGDLLSMLMGARDPETGEGMDDRQLRDELMTIFLAGHETTANALTWTLYVLALNPEIEGQVREEISAALAGRPATLADLPKLPLLDRVLLESMRLYPPVWSISRSATEEDVIGGFRIPKGSWVFLSTYLTQRDARFWPDPERFDPNRFLPGHEAKRPKGAYFPFAFGPRKCIGEGFALMEARLLLATILSEAKLLLVPGFVPQLDPTVTLRPKHGIPMVAARI